MHEGDVGFTFLHRVEEIEWNLTDRRWQSALALTLTLPDICGGIAFPELVKRYRDGRVMLDRQKNPSRDVGSQYIRWFDEFAGEYFKLSPKDARPYICGERCWQLRCEYLHQNKGFQNNGEISQVRFHLGVNCGTSVCQTEGQTVRTDGNAGMDESMDIRIDIEQFCRRMCKAARSYYEAVHREKDFSLYNTPVLDFVQKKRYGRTDRRTDEPRLVVILCEQTAYAKGLALALQSSTLGASTLELQIFPDAAAERKKLRKRSPDLRIITKEQFTKEYQPWNTDQKTPVILLGEELSGQITGKWTVLEKPIRLEELRRIVKKYLR